MTNEIEILGIRIFAGGFNSALEQIAAILRQNERKSLYICATSVHGVIEAQSDPDFRKTLNAAYFNAPDGMPLVRMGRLLGAKKIERIYGPDLFPAVCDLSSKMENISHFFYGGKEGVADKLAEALTKKYPGLIASGTYCPPFRPLTESEKQEVAKKINDSGADIVWVGLSTPKQEKWIAEIRELLNVKLLFSVGAAFDYQLGYIKQPPGWIQKASLEWLYRLVHEPSRLWGRYIRIVPAFIFLSLLQFAGLKKTK